VLTRRFIPCLDVRDGRVVKGVRFRDLRDAGDPAELAARYEADGADELVFLDVSATLEGRRALLAAVERTAARVFIPLTVGGGIRSPDDIRRLLESGADKVSINTAAVETPELVAEAAARFGSQCVVVAIDAALAPGMPCALGRWQVWTRAGTRATGRDALAWAGEAQALGAGEILLTSIDRDGTRSGYDLELTRAVADAVPIPVIASGGAGSAEHLVDAFLVGGADAVLLAGILHDGIATLAELKAAVAARGIPVRPPWADPDGAPPAQAGVNGGEP